jgi:nitrogen fixation-related uncharacterized protein
MWIELVVLIVVVAIMVLFFSGDDDQHGDKQKTIGDINKEIRQDLKKIYKRGRK